MRAHQGLEHGELLGGELEPSSVAARDVTQGVQFDSGHSKRPRPGGRPAAGQSADAKHELGEMEGL